MQINRFIIIKESFNINSIYKIIAKIPILIKPIKVDQRGLFIDKLFLMLAKMMYNVQISTEHDEYKEYISSK